MLDVIDSRGTIGFNKVNAYHIATRIEKDYRVGIMLPPVSRLPRRQNIGHFIKALSCFFSTLNHQVWTWYILRNEHSCNRLE